MAPRNPEEEEVTAEDAQSLLERGDRLAREYAREKEVKQRGDRVRRAESTQASIRPVSAESAEAPTRVRDLPRQTSGETGARRREHVPAERAPGPQAPQSPRLRPADAAPAERQALPTRQPPPRAGEGSPVQRRPDNAGDS